MIRSVRPRYHKAAPLELVLRRINEVLQSIDSIEQTSISDALNAIRKLYPTSKVTIPYCEPVPKGDEKYKLAFERPSGLQLVGSWPLQIAAERPQGLDVDLAVVMPSSIFQEKDHLNFRYFHKRAFYLAVIAAALSSTENLGVQILYSLEGGDAKKPLLVLKPISNKSETDFSRTKAEIRIHLACDADIFTLGRLAPSRNNIRASEASDDSASSTQQPTPLYNNAILADSLRGAHLVYLHATKKACPAFADACLLLRVWAFQRGFGSGLLSGSKSSSSASRRTAAGSDNARFFLTMVLAHLLHGEEKIPGRGSTRAKLANGFSSYQLFRGVIDWLASHDFVRQPIFMKSAPAHGLSSRSDKISRDGFAQHFSRVFVDPTGSVNFLASWLPGSVDLLQYEAKQTFAMLDDGETDHFDELFLVAKRNPNFVFDDVARCFAPKSLNQLERLDRGSSASASAAALSQTLSLGLQNRCRTVTILSLDSSHSWAVNGKKREHKDPIEIGILYNAAQALKLVEHGPPPEDAEAAQKFQDFWGEVAELRRFKDGRILYSIVWETSKQSQRWAIPQRIVRHVLARHHSLTKPEQLSFAAEAFAGLLQAPETIVEGSYLADPEEKGFQTVQTAFDNLSRQLRAMDDLPLSLISITPNSPGLRNTSTFIPAPLDLGTLGSSSTPDCASFLGAQEIVLTFESSGRWPDEPRAIQAMKLAFCERLAELLPTKVSGLQANVTLDPDASVPTIQDQASLELILPSGFAFRARIHHERERVLLQRIIADKLGESPARRDEANRALERWSRRFTRGPAHHAAVSALSHRYIAYGETVRLLKRWVRAHMLDAEGHVPDEALELIALTVFICPGSPVPSSGHAGFLQTLKKLSLWKWREEPLLVPVQSAVSASEQLQRSIDNEGSVSQAQAAVIRFPTERRVEAVEAFKLARSQDPGMSRRAWFLPTEDDVGSESFTPRGPSGATAHALQSLAAAAVRLMEEAAPQGIEQSTVMVRSLFTAGMSAFDFVLHLDPTVLPRYAPHYIAADSAVWLGPNHGKKSGFRNAIQTKAIRSQFGPVARPDFDPASAFVALLRSLYSDSMRLYHDPYGSPIIGGIFNPLLAGEKRRFKVAAGFNALPVAASESGVPEGKGQGSRDEVVLNTSAVLAEIERLGEGLVKRVEVRKSAAT